MPNFVPRIHDFRHSEFRRSLKRILATTLPAAILMVVVACVGNMPASVAQDPEQAAKPTAKTEQKPKKKIAWKPLFKKGASDGWKAINFGGEGDAAFEKDFVQIEQGVDLSGIVSTRKDHPKNNYEIQLEARRTEGSDFFVGMTFPVKDSYCSLIVGGWGGGLCGLSSLDGMDASENETTTYSSFTNGTWYKIRLRVTDELIEAWIDDENIVEADIIERKIGLRFEVEETAPIGFTTYQSTAQIRNAGIRKLTPRELKQARTEKKPALPADK